MILVKHHNEGNYEPFFYYALEHYILNELLKGDETYFFTWRLKGIISGKNQVIENEVNFPYVKEHGIKVFRRPTGGGSVYADENNTMFTIITKRSPEGFSFKKYLGKIIDAFKKLGVNLEFSGRNDILLDGKKVSGNAFLQNKNGMLMHGTMMYDLDIETMVRALNPPDEKLISKGIESVRSRVNNLKPYLNGMSHDALIEYLENELTDEVYELSEAEVEKLWKDAQYYMTDEFLYQIQPPFTQVLKKRFSWGGFELKLDIKEGIIEHAKIHGDFFELQDLKPFEDALVGQKYTFKFLEKVCENHPISEYILGSIDQDLIDLFKDAFLNV
ncbi:lipoate--protein ligase [Acholeplasma equirhinis]|uniref:lipoate--protein ligase n=1 Tax=Acholeplasma equirhinis TaxID=555393 RepID=UPI00197A8522|nr:lipoate--protein ligase [Acholeplasma equirhinis]MBN3490295.1 lipoate--protein ligase [Acholeplasma equirhinis]